MTTFLTLNSQLSQLFRVIFSVFEIVFVYLQTLRKKGKNMEYGSSTNTRSRLKFESPKRYNVIMHNDDFTTMDFVVSVLVTVFFKSREMATRLMLEVHHRDKAIVGTYSLDVATSKVNKATEMARLEGFPFQLSIEPAEDELPF